MAKTADTVAAQAQRCDRVATNCRRAVGGERELPRRETRPYRPEGRVLQDASGVAGIAICRLRPRPAWSSASMIAFIVAGVRDSIVPRLSQEL